MHLSSRCQPLVGLVLLMQLSVGAGQTTMESTPDPTNSCRFRGQLFQPDTNVPLEIIPSPVCVEFYCNQTEYGPSVDFVVVRGEDGCCELNGRLVPSGYTMYIGNCSEHECTSTGLSIRRIRHVDLLPCPLGSVSVFWGRSWRKCITVFPLTTNFTTALAYCTEMGGLLARPFGVNGRRDQRLVNAIGQVNGWLGARVPGESGDFWPSDSLVRSTPSSVWYNDTPILRSNAFGCMGYRFDNSTSSTNSSGGWHQYSCSDQLQPICDLNKPPSCSYTKCPSFPSDNPPMQHDEIMPHSATCLTKKCWFGRLRLLKDPICCTLEEPNGNKTAISLHQEGTFDTALQTCTCREAELTCSDRLVSNCPGSASPP